MVNVADAKAVAVLTSADLTNIETGRSGQESLGERWDDVPVVLRVFDRELARMMEQSFGFQHVRSTRRWRRPGSSAPPSGSRCSARSTWTSSRSWWPG